MVSHTGAVQPVLGVPLCNHIRTEIRVLDVKLLTRLEHAAGGGAGGPSWPSLGGQATLRIHQ
jgi:hypothetical protein